MRRAAIYYRVSTDEQATEGQSIPAQRKALVEYAIKNGYDVVADYADEGESARTADRPQFQRMISDAKQKPRPFDAILVHKWDRFARNREDSIVYKKLLRRDCGIDVLSISEPLEDGPVGMLLEGILELIAEFYSLNLAQEVRKGMKEKAGTGKALGMAPLGYRIGDEGFFEIVPEEATVVRYIFNQYVAGGIGLRTIAINLRKKGVEMFGEPGGRFKWSTTGLRAIITNPTYTGDFIWNRRDIAKKRQMRAAEEWIKVPSAHEAIISRELWEEANRILSGRKGPRAPQTDYVLRGLTRCLDCGGSISKIYMRWRTKEQNVKREALRCTRNAHSGECYFNFIYMDEAERAIIDYLKSIAAGQESDIQVTRPQSAQDEVVKELNSAKKELEELNDRFDRQMIAFEKNIITLDQFQKAQERLKKDEEILREKITQLEASVSSRVITLPIEDIKARVEAAVAIADNPDYPIAERRKALESVIDSMAYSKAQDRMVINLKV